MSRVAEQPVCRERRGSPLAQAIRPGLQTLRHTWPALLVLQVLGLLVVVGYFTTPTVTRIADWLGTLKASGGYLFSAVSLALACGPLPEIAKQVTGVDRCFSGDRLHRLLLNTGVYAIVGVQCDALYRIVAMLFGDELAFWTVLKKVATDQFLFSPFISLPTIALGYTWRDAGWRLGRLTTLLRRRWYVSKVVPMLLTCWAYWIPMASLMYMLPAKLTMVFNVCASAAGAILITGVAGRAHEAPADTVASHA